MREALFQKREAYRSSLQDTQLSFHYDTLIRRYVVYLRGRPNVRVITMAESEDCIDWTERELIVAPDEDDPPQDHELYGMSSMQVRSDEKHRR